MRCIICTRDIELNEYSVATTNGGRAHIVCADHLARNTRRIRGIKAAASGGIVVAGMIAAILMHGSMVATALLGLLGIAAHIGLNRLWWKLRLQSLRFRWRMRRQWWRHWRL